MRAIAWEMYLTPFRFSLFMTLGMAGAVNAGSSDDLCLPAVGRDVCGVPIVALLSRYDQLYGKKLSTYAYIYYDMGATRLFHTTEIRLCGPINTVACVFP